MSEMQEVSITQEPTPFEAPAPVSDTPRPDNVPEQFWNAEKGEIDTAALLAAVNGIKEETQEGTPEGEAEAEVEGGTEEEPKGDEEKSEGEALAEEAGVDVAAVEAHFLETGEIPADTYEKMAKVGISKEMVDEFVQYRANQADIVRDEVLRPYGGVEAVTEMTAWAGKNWNDDQVASFNEAVTSGNKAKIDLAVKALKADYDKANGSRPRLLSATNTAADAKGVFNSFQELAKAQSDPRYKTDPAYRDAVMAKLARSHI